MMNGTMNGFLLSILIWLPILGAVAVTATGAHRAEMAKGLALVITAVTFVLSLPLFFSFDTTTAAMQFVESRPWIETFNIHYKLGVDGFSAPLILLTAFFGVLVVIAGWRSIQKNVNQYMAAFLLMEGLMIGVFAALAVNFLMMAQLSLHIARISWASFWRAHVPAQGCSRHSVQA